VPLEAERWEWRELFASEHGPADPSTRLILFVLALHMNQQGDTAFPSQETIAKRSGLSVRSVRTHLDHAVNGGWLRISKKSRRGQAWFVHEYTATIPTALADRVASKPWVDDPKWQRAENSAGRVDKSPDSEGDPAILAEHPANDARRPAIDDTTPGKICRDARQGLPTNSSSNSSMNSPNNTSCERAVASDRTACVESLKGIGTEEAKKEAPEPRANRIRQAIAALPKDGDSDIAKIARVTLEEVQQVRRQA
jgi:hypothetical protein